MNFPRRLVTVRSRGATGASMTFLCKPTPTNRRKLHHWTSPDGSRYANLQGPSSNSNLLAFHAASELWCDCSPTPLIFTPLAATAGCTVFTAHRRRSCRRLLALSEFNQAFAALNPLSAGARGKSALVRNPSARGESLSLEHHRCR